MRVLPILANTTGVQGGGIQRGVIPRDQVVGTRWLGGFPEPDPNAGCRPVTSDGRRDEPPTYFLSRSLPGMGYTEPVGGE